MSHNFYYKIGATCNCCRRVFFDEISSIDDNGIITEFE